MYNPKVELMEPEHDGFQVPTFHGTHLDSFADSNQTTLGREGWSASILFYQAISSFLI